MWPIFLVKLEEWKDCGRVEGLRIFLNPSPLSCSIVRGSKLNKSCRALPFCSLCCLPSCFFYYLCNYMYINRYDIPVLIINKKGIAVWINVCTLSSIFLCKPMIVLIVKRIRFYFWSSLFHAKLDAKSTRNC